MRGWKTRGLWKDTGVEWEGKRGDRRRARERWKERRWREREGAVSRCRKKIYHTGFTASNILTARPWKVLTSKLRI